MERREFLYVASLGTAVAATAGPLAQAQRQSGSTVSLTRETDGYTIHAPDGRIVTGYVTRKPAGTDMTAPSVCCFHPLQSPAGERLTVFGAGHQHYRGVFFGWHTVEFREHIEQPAARGGRGRAAGGAAQGRAGGQPPQTVSPEAEARGASPKRGNVLIGDYWGWGRYAPLDGRIIRNRDVRLAASDSRSATLEIRNEWTINDQALMDEALTAVVRVASDVNLLELTYRFAPKGVDVVLPEWSFGGFCVSGRSDAESAYYEGPQGRVERGNPSMFDGATSWPDEAWYSRTHVLGGKTSGYLVANHPSNPRTRWWNPPTTGNIQPSIVTYGEFAIPAGQTLTLRYLVAAYDGALTAERKTQLANEFRTT